MDRQHIISEIRRTAIDGKPLGSQAFFTTTGIKAHDWRGKYWARWGDALIEAGFTPNVWIARVDESHIFQSLAAFTRKLGRFPTLSEMGIERRKDKNFPSSKTVQSHCNKAELIGKVLEFCQAQEGYKDVEEILRKTELPAQRKELPELKDGTIQLGYVYLLQSARLYKIGFSKAALNRASVVGNLSPEGGEIIHLIRTDDMRGIEAYWHRRFADKRGNGEWFALSAADVAAFKRRKFM
jgi:hypothetical protein